MTWIQTATGRRFDLANPRAADVDFDTDVPDALARIARFTGHIGAGPYSVAQHSVHCCDVVLGETGDVVGAAFALLHDAHEAYIGDWSTPLHWAIEAITAEGWGPQAAEITRAAHVRLKLHLDLAIHEAAGLPFLQRPARLVKEIDLRMLLAERLQLLNRERGPNPAWAMDADPPRSPRIALKVWPWPEAAAQFRERFRRIVPQAREALAAREIKRAAE